MTRSNRLRISRAGELTNKSYDLLIVGCGYESRSRAVTEELSGRFDELVALDYRSGRVHSYEENRAFFEAAEARFIADVEGVGRLELTRLLERVTSGKDESHARIGVDISSLDRDRIAILVTAILKHLPGVFEVDFWYSEGAFGAALKGSAGHIMVNRPAITLEGWSSRPDWPLAAIAGLGFEAELSLAALESLEPAETYLFQGRGHDSRFSEIVAARNKTLFESTRGASAFYDVNQPFSLFKDLEGLVHQLISRNRVVLVPVGPKIFALCSCLVAAGYEDEVAVWRVSSDSAREPEERKASGQIVGLTVEVHGG